jgi:uncharacterized protein (DUF362 family)
MRRSISRRQFIELFGSVGGALFLSACQRALTPAPAPESTPTLTEMPTAVPATATSTVPAATPTSQYKAMVAVGRAKTYDRAVIRQELEKMLDGLGGIADVVKPGAKVGIKVNMTGAYYQNGVTNPPATEYFATNPAVAGAVSELLLDAGASKVYVMDGLGVAKPVVFDTWGYSDMAKSVGAELVDLSYPDPYAAFVDLPVGPGWLVYETFTLNPLLGELDAFVSIGKMKPHSYAGVTLSMKNLMGITPLSVYSAFPGETWREKIHGDRNMDKHLGRAILDLNRVRPVHLSVVDGVMTMQGGADLWEDGVSQVKPGLLVAGKNPLATDTVGAALMGFDATAPSGSVPFLHIENYLAMAHEIGLGTNRLEEIGIAGPSIQEAMFKFKPAP